MITITTRPDHKLSGNMQTVEREARSVVRCALRRVGGESVDWGCRSGTRIDSARLHASGMPDPRAFGRLSQGNEGRAAIGVCVLIDGSGSMSSGSGRKGMTRLQHARAVACGIVAGCADVGIAALVWHHSTNGSEMKLSAQRTTSAVCKTATSNGNADGIAVRMFAAAVRMPAERTVFVLICDGAPCRGTKEHAPMCDDARRLLMRHGASFITAFIGESATELEQSRSDWGACRTADCRGDSSGLTAPLMRAVGAIMQR